MKNIVLAFIFGMLILAGCNSVKPYDASPNEQPPSLFPFLESPDTKVIYPSYFEMVKNTTTGDYYVYFILMNKPGYNVVTPVQANITMVDPDGKTFYSHSFDVKKEDYVMYTSRISNKPIGKAFVVPIDYELINQSWYSFDMRLDIYIPEAVPEKQLNEYRMVKVKNIAEVD
ncbi:Uncharacterised protein [Candidatus Bilamarchaeum dharawalense]|uniref:Lipoprotein n=1 Tax=Candidatus Bilamarchaeum dharawalense TaxID=2885759 RepID=A0A5E4LU92_9ARCH|nr:Uncharacterised protein [Candidatus Bilamarchaeum dharawalense]